MLQNLGERLGQSMRLNLQELMMSNVIHPSRKAYCLFLQWLKQRWKWLKRQLTVFCRSELRKTLLLLYLLVSKENGLCLSKIKMNLALIELYRDSDYFMDLIQK